MPIPDFANEAIFPAFDGLPIEDAGAADPPSYAASSEPPSYVPPPPPDPPSYSDSQSSASAATASLIDTAATTPAASSATAVVTTPKPSSHDAREEWFLVAEVRQNMTITKPTLVVVDRAGTEFAVTFEDRGIDLRPECQKEDWKTHKNDCKILKGMTMAVISVVEVEGELG
ncbi:hypothetical protein CSHISOI_11185, partial [Colletotrichum shisoi]